MKKYIRIYAMYLRLNFAALIVYRANFINNILGSSVWGFFSILTIVLMMSRTSSLFGWSKNEIFLLTGVYSLFIGIFHTLFSRNFERMTYLIRLGLLDAVLIKPIDSQFAVSTSIVNYASLIRILTGAGFIWYVLATAHIPVTPLMMGIFLLFTVVGLLLLYSIWFMVSTLIIWFPDLSNLIDFLYSYSNIGRYPREMYLQLNTFLFFFILPLTFFVVSPTKALLGKLNAFDVFGLCMAAVTFFVISRLFWKFALRFYTSASN